MIKFARVADYDVRDADYLLRASRKASKRTSRYWLGSWHGDQGDTPHCVGYAWAHWLSMSPIRQWLAPDGIYHFSQLSDRWPGEDYEGTSVAAGAFVLASLGLIREYRWTTSVATLANTVLERGPVVVGTDWYAGMNDEDDMVADGELLGGHAYVVDGVNVKRKVFRIKNSWSGFTRGWLPFAEMRKLLAADGECCLGIESAARA